MNTTHKPKELPSLDYLNECFIYASGELIWKSRPRIHFNSDRGFNSWNARHANKVAGRVMPGKCQYVQVGINGKRYLAHRIILTMHGFEILGVVDHINGNGLDNRIENLRPATHAQNTRNCSARKNKLLPKGVSMNRDGRFVAFIRDNGRQLFLGRFKSAEEAVAARANSEKKIYGEFSPLVCRSFVGEAA